ncbi:Membrane-bound lytic murein transglycosylase A family protein [uncultured Desulfobacterium sp.]|uniref:peptidoglycan lytic exotransglycosylase n=1 Tax=uncultured Desulfobacterium sp. TaxID=201089 RepID=A0A445MWW6_9BACT|nr:Membrane-bound lytic murein transglycosylase A family protein [uncultured Desulfobacterium sp.]
MRNILVTTARLILWFAVVCLLGCYPALRKEALRPEEALTPIRFFYPEFCDDMDQGSLKKVIERNMVYLKKIDPETVFKYGADSITCRQIKQSQEAFLSLISTSHDWRQLNKEIRRQFRLYRAAGRAGNKNVLFTGYFEPVYDARTSPDHIFKYPLYRKPDDLVSIDLSEFSNRFKNERLTARVERNQVMPYYTRHQIEIENALKGKGLEIAWLRDPLDVTFLQIQGSGRLNLANGKTLRVGYCASNGRAYRSIGNYMLQKGFLTKENVSMQEIRRYLSEHPEVREEVLSSNPSYVFFRILESEPVGNINVPLVPGRSIALDAKVFPKGALAFMICQKPDVDNNNKITGWKKFSRFVINQDTGGAITGAGRADLFWGCGPYAEVAAGHMKHEGELYMLIKKE